MADCTGKRLEEAVPKVESTLLEQSLIFIYVEMVPVLLVGLCAGKENTTSRINKQIKRPRFVIFKRRNSFRKRDAN